jgi:hypothetical protein
MAKARLYSAVAMLSALITTPVLAQEMGGGPIGPGSRYGLQPDAFSTGIDLGGWRGAPFWDCDCAQRHRSYYSTSGTFMGSDGRRHTRTFR